VEEPERRLTPRDAPELRARLDRAWTELEAALAGVPPERLEAAGPDGGWSARDHLAYLATWARVALLRAHGGYAAEREAPIFGLDTETYRATHGDALNDVGYRLNRSRPAGEVLAELRDVQARIAAAMAALGEAELPFSRPRLRTILDALA
jgi:hypothetical protein